MDRTAALSSWCEISLPSIEGNLIRALTLLPRNAMFCAVLKSDAYGHGIANVVPILSRNKVQNIGIVSNQEARAVRDAGFTGHVIRLRCATLAEAQAALPLRIEEQISSPEGARIWRELHSTAPVHLALNADGMSRDALELRSDRGRQKAQEILELCAGHIRGICTHYPSNTCEDLAKTAACFAEDAAWIVQHGKLDRQQILIHAGSSLTLVADAPPPTDMLRCGAILYGILKPDLGFEPTMTVKSRVVSLSSYSAGNSVGYDRTVRLNRDSRLASVSIGYANGIERHWTDRFHVLIQGKHVPVLGKVSMNLLTIDVTDVPVIEVGDEVVIFGAQAGSCIDPTQIQVQSSTIMAELYASWGQRNTQIPCDKCSVVSKFRWTASSTCGT
ncbi:Broad specificity amino-acid racemase [Roseobacter fucihabitans]|uniref:alanine racemase n=1 Tax=Roseobacter fucihabitans TaxID=1537242 RepID=A0ABZ2BX40_9RHOB|nr:alanine racemase C-terminal domain-containing protein [Roseobacter litoralis]MBC6967230.1 Alanine racemase [Roseobacter litoralis]